MPDTPLNSLSSQAIENRLRTEAGLRFKIGPFSVCVKSRLADIGTHIKEMYGHYSQSDSAFADLHFSVDAPIGLRGLLRKQVNFSFDSETPFKPLPYNQARPFFEWGLNWCIATTAHQYHIIHAAVVAKSSRCAVIPGRPGAGKSTLCAALVASGWRLLSDEMALIELESGLIWPIPRPISLKNNSIDLIRARFPDVFVGPSFFDTHKGTVAHMQAPESSVHQSNQSCSAAWVVFPGYQAGAELAATPVSTCHSILRLAEQSFNLPLLGAKGFNLLSEVTAGCEAFELRYSKLDDAIAWFDQLASA